MMELTDNDETNQDLTIITEKQKENFRNRMSMLILEKFTPAIKVVFDKEIHPDELGKMVNENLEKLHTLFERNILTPKQWNKLLPKKESMPLSSNTFDGTLMICLLRLILGEKIPDRLPLPTDISRIADLSRLLHYRNMICHFDDQFDYSKSVAALDDCIQAIQRLSGLDCNDYKTKLFGDCSKDCRVIIAALIFLYREGCDLERIGLSCAFWEVTHVEQMGALLWLCCYYKLLEPVVSSLWIDLTKGKQFGVLDRFVNEIFNGNTTVEVPKYEDLPSSTVTDAYQDDERRNSYLLCLAAMGIKRCTFNYRKTENEDDHTHELTRTESLTLYGEHAVTFPVPDEFKLRKQPEGTHCELKSPRYTAERDALKGRENKTEMPSQWSNSLISISSFCKGDNTQLPGQFTDTYSCSDASSASLRNEQSILQYVFPCRQLQLHTQRNSSQTVCATEDYSSASVLNHYYSHYNNNDSSITDSAFAAQDSFVDLLSSFSSSDLLTNARNDQCSLYDSENVSHSSVAITNESCWNNSSSNGTDWACYTGYGNDTGYCMIL